MQSRFYVLAILTIATVLFFLNLGKPKLWDRDEPRNARCAVEMFERADLVVPTFNDELRTHKPVLLYWLMMSAYSVFGISEFSARFWSAAFGVGTTLLTFLIGRQLFDSKTGFMSAIVLASTLMFNVAAHAATPDSTLIFFSTLALSIYVLTVYPNRIQSSKSECVSELPQPAPVCKWYPSGKNFLMMFGVMGIAILAKGPVGIVLPTAVIGMFLLIQRLHEPELTAKRCSDWRFRSQSAVQTSDSWLSKLLSLAKPFAPLHFLRTVWFMRPFTALVAASMVALPWYAVVGIETYGEWLRGFFLEHNVARATSAMEGHRGSILIYYPIAILVGFFPWSILAVPVALDLVGQFKAAPVESRNWLNLPTRSIARNGVSNSNVQNTFLLCWVGVYVGLFSLAQTKLPNYVTPCYPAIAILVGRFTIRLSKGSSRVSANWIRAAMASLVLVGIALSISLPIASHALLPGEELLGLVGVIPLTAGVLMLVLSPERRHRLLPKCLGTTAVVFCLVVFAVIAPRISRYQMIEGLLARAASQPVASFVCHEPSWVFYANRKIAFFPIQDIQNACNYLENSNGTLITTPSGLSRIEQETSIKTRVLQEAEYFLQGQRLLLIESVSPIRVADVDATTFLN